MSKKLHSFVRKCSFCSGTGRIKETKKICFPCEGIGYIMFDQEGNRVFSTDTSVEESHENQTPKILREINHDDI